MAGGTRLWLQEALVAKGLARVYSFSDNRACVAELVAREAEARAKRRGLWGSSLYRVASALDLERLGCLTHSYQLVEGTVAAVGEGRGPIYLNFAKDWRSDFTVTASTAKTRPRSPPPASTSKASQANACACAASSAGATGR